MSTIALYRFQCLLPASSYDYRYDIATSGSGARPKFHTDLGVRGEHVRSGRNQARDFGGRVWRGGMPRQPCEMFAEKADQGANVSLWWLTDLALLHDQASP